MRLRVRRNHDLSVPRIDNHVVAEKLKAEGKQEIFRAEEMEEIEDEEGNVYNRKVYNDLKTQGMLASYEACYLC